MRQGWFVLALTAILSAQVQGACNIAFTTTGGWTLRVSVGEQFENFAIEPPPRRVVTNEAFSLPPFRPDAWLMSKGMSPAGVISDGSCSTKYALDLFSARLTLLDGTLIERGRDWECEQDWARFGYLPGGRLNERNSKVLISYSVGLMRVDAIVQNRDGRIVLRRGVPRLCTPQIPYVGEDERFLGSIFVEPCMTQLDADHLFPKLEDGLPIAGSGELAARCPKAYAKLVAGQPVRILAWGDSVTDLKYLGRGEKRWQNQFVKRLMRVYPQARIELVTAAWGGHTSVDFLNAQPTDREHHFQTAVLGCKPDLVVSEFVNDGCVAGPRLDAVYGKILSEFRKVGAEWIICTPHYVRPDHMGAKNLKTDYDPRWNTQSIREFCRTNGLACADAARRWGHLWREGRAYLPHLINNLNHPDAETVKIYADSLMELIPEKDKAPRKIFSASFDGTARAEMSEGNPEPLANSRGLVFVPGRRGQAIEFRNDRFGTLSYATVGNLIARQGSVAFWFRPAAANFTGRYDVGRVFFSTERVEKRLGSGQLKFWKYGQLLRGDTGDDGDSRVTSPARLVSGGWNHLVFTWDPDGVRIYLNGKACTEGHLSLDQIRIAQRSKHGPDACSYSSRVDPRCFHVGGLDGWERMDGAMDDLSIWSAPLSSEEVCRLYRDESAGDRLAVPADYSVRFADADFSAYVSSPSGKDGVPGEVELVDRVVFDAIPEKSDSFNAVGEWKMGELGGMKYLESSGKVHERFVKRFHLDRSVPLYVFEVDYPDDRKRTMDFVIQGATETRWDGQNEADYVSHTGVMCGDEYPNSNRMLTHRCLYWQRGEDVALSAMTLRGGAPAAVREVRVYKVLSGRLPEARVEEAAANSNDWHRTFALYYEDPAAGYDFGVDGTDEGKIGDMIDRLIASMKYVGQNVLCYPGAWYDGLIDGVLYNPRDPADGYRTAFYAKFDRAGLGFMPTLNWHDMRMPFGAVTRMSLDDGSFADSQLSVLSNGFVNARGTHGRPPNVNVMHPKSQEQIERVVDRLIAEGRGHPSFRGIVLHLTKHSCLWFGDLAAGYNDYCLERFSFECGIELPPFREVDRGRRYADWIRIHCLDEWIGWRCKVVADLYKRIAARLAAEDPRLKLVVNSFLPPSREAMDVGDSGYVARVNRLAGLDAGLLSDIPNISVCQTIIPADYRWRSPYDPINPRSWEKSYDMTSSAHRTLYYRFDDFVQISSSAYPWVNIHDRYWESAIGRETANKPAESLSSPWFNECPWRCSTVNPAGRYALKQFSVPLRYQDVLAVSKGGFLIGTYGMEDVLIPWIRSFRALPAVRMHEFFRSGDVIGRTCEFQGVDYWYFVNTGDREQEVMLPVPEGTADLLTGQVITESGRLLQFKPYELRSYRRQAEFGSAKWIGPASEFRPEEDFGAARWLTVARGTNEVSVLERTFVCSDRPEERPVDAVFTGSSAYEIYINGKRFYKWTGQVRDSRYPVCRDLRPWLVPGENSLHVRLSGSGEQSFIGKVTMADGRVIGTEADGWSSPQGEVRALGRVRETELGRRLKLRTETHASAFAKKFRVDGSPASAKLKVTGVGFYIAYLNGKKIGEKVLDPSPTAYDKRVLYSTFDLTDMLKHGENELVILLGHGWYDNRSVATWNFEVAPWRDFPRAIAELVIVGEDGAMQVVGTDGTWRHVVNPVVYDDIYEGEVIDGRICAGAELPDGRRFAAEVQGPSGRLVSEQQFGARVMDEIQANSVRKLDSDTWLIEFPVNVSGWIRMPLKGQRSGDVLSFRYDEREEGDRKIDRFFRSAASHRFCATDAAFQCDRYICRGEDGEVYEPRFSYKGFRYVRVRGLAQPPRVEDVVARLVHTGFRTIGSFSCSDPVFNELMAMGVRSYKCNFTDGIPTDCPHREKNGWTGDASIASELAQYLFENTTGYEKFLRDIIDAQRPDGNLPGIVPTSGWGFSWGNGPAWDSALPVIAWNLWIYRGDRAILDEVYPALKKYLSYTATKADSEGLVSHGLGDWIAVNPTHIPSVTFTSSCYYYQAQRIAAEIARVKGLINESAAFNVAARLTREGLRHHFMKADGVWDNGGQTAQGMALAFGLPDVSERKAAERQLVRSVENAANHVDMGVLGMKHVFRALSRAGRTDLAYKMLTNQASPSPVDWLRKGGTTLWEDWNDGESRNHIMFGDFVGWAYQYLAGIRLEESPDSTSAVTIPTQVAFRRVTIEPSFLPELTGLAAKTEVYGGCLSVSWQRNSDGNQVEMRIPEGVEADVRLPGLKPRLCRAGTWRFVCDNR